MLGTILVRLIRFYQVSVSSWTPASCRFHPTCSAYAVEAVERYGGARGGWMTLRRLARCHPWGGSGYDPVPLESNGLPAPLEHAGASDPAPDHPGDR